MKFIYISPLRYPSEKAGSLFSVKSCETFVDGGLEVELWVPRRRNHLKGDVYEYFGVKKNFKIKYFFVLDLMWISPKFFNLLSYTFAKSVFLYVLFKKMFGKISDYVFYSHEQFALFLLTFLSKKTFYEIHDFPAKNKMYESLFKRVRGVVTTNKWKEIELTRRFKLSQDKIMSVPNAADLKDFSNEISKDDARVKLHLSKRDYLIGYVGTLKTMGMEKGIAMAIDSLKLLPDDFKLYIVGGENKDIEYYKQYALLNNLHGRIIFAGRVPHKEVYLHIAVCDCLIAPFPDNDHYSYYMSPMKIFEYMASNRPIIASNLPSIREILQDGETSILVTKGTPEALFVAIKRLVDNREFCQKIAQNAFLEVKEKYTWERRVKIIIKFLETFN